MGLHQRVSNNITNLIDKCDQCINFINNGCAHYYSHENEFPPEIKKAINVHLEEANTIKNRYQPYIDELSSLKKSIFGKEPDEVQLLIPKIDFIESEINRLISKQKGLNNTVRGYTKDEHFIKLFNEFQARKNEQ